MEHTMKLFEEPYKKIMAGKKIVEIRLLDEKRQKVSVGDIIHFLRLPDLGRVINVEVVALLKYKTFKDLVEDLGMECLGYPVNYSFDDFLNGLYKIYSREKELKYGVLGIEIKLLDEEFNIRF